MPKKIMNKPTRLRTLFGRIRVDAHAIWRGPANIIMNNLKGERFYGWDNLSLEIVSALSDHVESRIVYANLFDKSQKSAVLRAVYWDGSLVRKTLKEQPDSFELIMPARFVIVPVRRLRAWLSEFSDIGIKISSAYEVDRTVDIRRLRIERDYTAQIFEKVWERQDSDHALLNEKWDSVWMQMTSILTQEPPIKVPQEDFWFMNPKVQYDFQGYQPDRHVLK